MHLSIYDLVQICRDHDWEDLDLEHCGLTQSARDYPDNAKTIAQEIKAWEERVLERYFASQRREREEAEAASAVLIERSESDDDMGE